MSIKSDRWIRRMAEGHGMIEPFQPGQVRTREDGGRVISYGVSSYGYDVRCADEFKIFTNINSTIVDPKNFDERSFVDVKGAQCIIPPNSFALARTMEYFRIPRDTLVVCLGKSTYARCFRGDTRVALVDGTTPTLEDMARRADAGEQFWGYSIGENGRLIVSLLDAPRHVGRDSLLEVVLDHGKSVFATPDHLFMLRDGQWRAAGELRPGTSLMPLYRDLHRGYEMSYQPINGHLVPTHRLADEWNLRHGVYPDQPGTHRHHLDHDRLNNNPWNVVRMDGMAEPAHVRHQNIERYRDAAEQAREDERVKLAWQTVLDQGRVAGPRAMLGHVGASQIAPTLRNHKVEAVREVPGDHDVYCLSVPEAGNFALADGVFVKNCGIIVNVTPLEPEWEGHVTLEFSNTTPLPARIYAGEGVAQFLFFQADEVCETSYADRKGKYQGQQGVTLPRA